MKSRMTIVDVAREAGVSKTAVSFAFNSPERLAASTLRRILEKSEEMGYVPNPMARGLAHNSSGNLGVLVPHSLRQAFHHPHFQEFFQGVGDFCQQRKLNLTLIPPREGSMLQAVRNAGVDGVITLGFTPSVALLALLKNRGLPLVTVDSLVGSVSSVTVQDQTSSQELLARILERGFRRVHILSFPRIQGIRGNAGSRSLTRRLRGFLAALPSAPAQDLSVTFGSSLVSPQSARDSLLKQSWPEGHPQAVVCLSDSQAAGVYLYAEAQGLKIPEDLSVTGFDGSTDFRQLRPSLTTIRQSGALKGRLAAELLEDQWKGRNTVRHVLVGTRFIEGGSLGFPKSTT